jgi:hypothetical protein
MPYSFEKWLPGGMNKLPSILIYIQSNMLLKMTRISHRGRGDVGKKQGSVLANTFRNYLFFWIIPGLTGTAAAQFRSLELLTIPIVILVSIGLLDSLDQKLARYPAVLEIPGVGPALERVASLRAHYWENEPKIRSAFKQLFLQARTQYKPYWGLAGIIAATVIIEGVITFEDNTSYIPPLGAVEIVGTAAVVAAVVALINLVPITALSYHYSLSGNRRRLGFMTVGALVATITGYAGNDFFFSEDARNPGSGTLPSYLSAQRLAKRMQDPAFGEELLVKMDVFLNYYINTEIPEEVMREDLGNLLVGIAPNDEPSAFGVLVSDRWAGILYHHAGAGCSSEGYNNFSLLAVVSIPTEEQRITELELLANDENNPILDVVDYIARKEIYYSWNDVPEVPGGLHEYITSEDCQSLIGDRYTSSL